MASNFKLLLISTLLLTVATANAGEIDKGYHTITTMQVREYTPDVLGQNKLSASYEMDMGMGYDIYGPPTPTDEAGKVISMARDIVALGEDVYNLVAKGKPTNKTDYAPISVVPREGNGAVDILDTENWTMPVKRTYTVTYKNTYRQDVVVFSYSVMYAYRGTYNGTGAYLTSVQIVPQSVRTLWGFDFTANMKLGGIVNQGTRANPVAGATILLEYNVSSLIVTQTTVDTFFINGKGGFKKL